MEIYIKMCEKAEEVQAIWHNSGYEGDDIWLPTQSELQSMLLPDPQAKDAWGEPFEFDGKTDNVFWLFLGFSESLQERKYSQQTGEHLWLRYVMKKKYGKVWDGNDWVKDAERDTI